VRDQGGFAEGIVVYMRTVQKHQNNQYAETDEERRRADDRVRALHELREPMEVLR
jgi:hypothetical protein